MRGWFSYLAAALAGATYLMAVPLGERLGVRLVAAGRRRYSCNNIGLDVACSPGAWDVPTKSFRREGAEHV